MRKEKLNKLPGRDIAVFLMSLMLAFGIWLIHNLSLQYSETLSVPVVAECDISGHSNVSANSSTIAARCRTSGFSILRGRHKAKKDAIHVSCAIYQNCDAVITTDKRITKYIDDEIKSSDGKGYQMLSYIVNNAKNNKTLALSRNKYKYDDFRDLGNYSAHNVYFIATYQEIDRIKLDYKAMLDELYQKAGLF